MSDNAAAKKDVPVDKFELTEEGFMAFTKGINDKIAEMANTKVNWPDVESQLKELVQDEVTKQTDARLAKMKGNKLFGGGDPAGGWNSMNHFAWDVYKADKSGGSVVSKVLSDWQVKCAAVNKAIGSPNQNIGDPETGGFLLPPEFSTDIMFRATERSNILNRAMVIPMQAQVVQIPYLKDFDRSQGKVSGNISFDWVGEDADRGTGKNMKFKLRELRLREASAMVFLSNSLLKFSPISIEPLMTRGLDEAMDLALSDAFIDGTGAGQPEGILNSNALVTVSKEVGQAANTVEYANILKMFAQHYGTTREWYANQTIIPELGQMTITGGTSAVPVFLPSPGGAAAPPHDTLLGRPLFFTEYAKTLGTKGDLILADWSQYLIGKSASGPDMEVAESIHLKFDFNQKAFRFTFYIDGRTWWPESFTPRNGDPRSPFVVLESRT